MAKEKWRQQNWATKKSLEIRAHDARGIGKGAVLGNSKSKEARAVRVRFNDARA